MQDLSERTISSRLGFGDSVTTRGCFGCTGTNVSNDSFDVSVPSRKRRRQFSDVALRRPDVQVWDAESANVVNLGWVENAHERIAHHDGVQVGSAEGCR